MKEIENRWEEDVFYAPTLPENATPGERVQYYNLRIQDERRFLQGKNADVVPGWRKEMAKKRIGYYESCRDALLGLKKSKAASVHSLRRKLRCRGLYKDSEEPVQMTIDFHK